MFFGCLPCCGGGCNISGSYVAATLQGSISVTIPEHEVLSTVDDITTTEPAYSETIGFALVFTPTTLEFSLESGTQTRARAFDSDTYDVRLVADVEHEANFSDANSFRSFVFLLELDIIGSSFSPFGGQAWDARFLYQPCGSSSTEQISYQAVMQRPEESVTTELAFTAAERFQLDNPATMRARTSSLTYSADVPVLAGEVPIVIEGKFQAPDGRVDPEGEVVAGPYVANLTLTIDQYLIERSDGTTEFGIPRGFESLQWETY